MHDKPGPSCPPFCSARGAKKKKEKNRSLFLGPQLFFVNPRKHFSVGRLISRNFILNKWGLIFAEVRNLYAITQLNTKILRLFNFVCIFLFTEFTVKKFDKHERKRRQVSSQQIDKNSRCSTRIPSNFSRLWNNKNLATHTKKVMTGWIEQNIVEKKSINWDDQTSKRKSSS